MNEEMKELGKDLDDKESSCGNTSPRHHASMGSSVQYKSQLAGWSPSQHPRNTPPPSISSLESLSLSDPPKKKNKSIPKDIKIPPKKPKLSKKERRELQEAQRLAKSKKQPPPTTTNVTPDKKAATPLQYDDKKRMAKSSKLAYVPSVPAQKMVSLFSHLRQQERLDTSLLGKKIAFRKSQVHPSVVTLGLKMAEQRVSGSNTRCAEMLRAFKDVIRDYETSTNSEDSSSTTTTTNARRPSSSNTTNSVDGMSMRELYKTLRHNIQFLSDCRPLSISMGNGIRFLKHQLATAARVAATSDSLLSTEAEGKAYLLAAIDTYLTEKISVAAEAIVNKALSKIQDDDVILTYSHCSVVQALLKRAFSNEKRFRVVVVDSRPTSLGRKTLSSLTSHGIQCTYVDITSLPYVMQSVTKVFLGAAAFMTNGAAVSRIGTATIAMAATAFKVPVLFVCETYKFTDRVQLDSFTANELCDPDELVSTNTSVGEEVLSDWRDIASLKLLNLVYDVTPARYVTTVVTEAGMMPPTSVPVLLREYRKETTDSF